MSDEEVPDINSLWDYDQPAESEARFRALMDAVGGQPVRRAELLTQIARAQGLQRRFADAQVTLDEVEAILPGLPTRPRVRFLLERGRVFNSAGDPVRARPYFEGALAMAEGDPDEQFYAVDAAHMLAIIAPPGEALAWNQRALAMAEASTDERTRRWRGSLLNNIGWAYHAAGDYPAALEYLEQALTFQREQGQAESIRVARWCVARVWRDVDRFDEALAVQRALLAEYEALGESSGYTLEELGECLLLSGDAAAARPYFAAAYRELAADPWLVANEPERLERLRGLGEEN